MPRLRKVVNNRIIEMTVEEENEFLNSINIPPIPRRVSKCVIADRIVEAGRGRAAFSYFNQNPDFFLRWVSPGGPDVLSSDANIREFLSDIGTDPDEILA